jgi:hypothetical protein
VVVEYIEFRVTFLYLDNIASAKFDNRYGMQIPARCCGAMCVSRLKQRSWSSRSMDLTDRS